MGWGLGGGGFGGLVNSITGASQSARQQNQYAVAMSRMNFKQQKDMYEWQAKEGPKMQMEGYTNAGVNPIYGLGGLNPSAGAGGTGGAPGGGAGGIGLISALADMYNGTRATDAKIGLDQANADLARAQADATRRGTIPQTLGEIGGETINNAVTSAKNITKKIKREWNKDKDKYEKAKNAKEAWSNIMKL